MRTLTLILLSTAACGILPDYRQPIQWPPGRRPASLPGSRPDSRPAQTSWLQAPPASEGWTPVELSLTKDLEFGDLHTDVAPLRLGLIGSEDRTVYGLDLNLGIGRTLAGGGGLAIALVGNSTLRDFHGVQIAGLVNWQVWGWERQTSLWGVQLSPVANVASSLYGVQVGGLNGAVRAHGLQLGVLSMSSHLEGVAAGAVLSFAEGGSGLMLAPLNLCPQDLTGVQIGLFNLAGSGVQIGLLNFNKNGFLPVCPLVNF